MTPNGLLVQSQLSIPRGFPGGRSQAQSSHVNTEAREKIRYQLLIKKPNCSWINFLPLHGRHIHTVCENAHVCKLQSRARISIASFGGGEGEWRGVSPCAHTGAQTHNTHTVQINLKWEKGCQKLFAAVLEPDSAVSVIRVQIHAYNTYT